MSYFVQCSFLFFSVIVLYVYVCTVLHVFWSGLSHFMMKINTPCKRTRGPRACLGLHARAGAIKNCVVSFRKEMRCIHVNAVKKLRKGLLPKILVPGRELYGPGTLRMAMQQRRVSRHASRLVVVLATTHIYEPPILRSIVVENQKITLFVGFSQQ